MDRIDKYSKKIRLRSSRGKEYLVNILDDYNERYKDVELIGEGGFGQVWESLYKPTRTTVAIKKLPFSPSELEMVLIELQALAEFAKDPNDYIPMYYTTFVTREPKSKSNPEGLTINIVMEFIRGQDAEEYFDDLFDANYPKVPESELLKFAIDLIKIIKYIHSKGWVHKDIKPQNIRMNERTKKPMLLDFGISCKFIQDPNNPAATCPSKESAGSILYMSPQDLISFASKYDPGKMTRQELFIKSKTDIWMYGVTMFHLLTGSYPYVRIATNEEIKKPAILASILKSKNNVVPISFDYRAVDPRFENVLMVIEQCLRGTPELRPSPDEILRLLNLRRY